MTSGTYGGGTLGTPWGFGGGFYVDNHGRIYPQLYGGTPGLSLSGGYTPDLEGLLTGPSISWSPGKGPVRYNAGGNADTIGAGIGTPGIGVTHGFGPIELSQDYSQPWKIPSIRDAAARAGVPSRYNVFEYGFPDASTDRPGSEAADELKRLGNELTRMTEAAPREVPPLSPAPESSSGNGRSTVDVDVSAPVQITNARRYLGRRSADGTQSSSFGGLKTKSHASLRVSPSLGLITNMPMPDWPVPPPIFGIEGRSGRGDNSRDSDDARKKTGIPFLDEYIEYLSRP